LGEFTRKQASLENNITIYVQLLSYVYSVGKILSMSFQELLSNHTAFKQNFMRRLYVPVYARILQKLSLNQIKLMTKKANYQFLHTFHFTSMNLYCLTNYTEVVVTDRWRQGRERNGNSASMKMSNENGCSQWHETHDHHKQEVYTCTPHNTCSPVCTGKSKS